MPWPRVAELPAVPCDRFPVPTHLLALRQTWHDPEKRFNRHFFSKSKRCLTEDQGKGGVRNPESGSPPTEDGREWDDSYVNS
jgi:hypothetical protein